MTSLTDLLASYFSLQQQKVTEIVTQLDQLRQQFEAQLRKLQKRELGFVKAQEEVLEQIRPLLASDARSLVLTPNFQEYLHTLLEQDIWQYSQLRLQLNVSDLSTWLLPTLEFPVQLSNVERAQPDAAADQAIDAIGSVSLHLQVGLWQQELKIPTVSVEEAKPNHPGADDVEPQWLNAGQCLKQSIEAELFEFVVSPNLTPAQHSQLIMELTCLLAYVTALFNIH